ncbi:MAG: prepilin-type N-terminal cleavage/methylation domain-containing protein [Alphaproteobacteria bacterium]|nr:prepilin-type N-terminal cleavage/methylation domain-containing protein [Alphaproteobacteria bacterium]
MPRSRKYRATAGRSHRQAGFTLLELLVALTLLSLVFAALFGELRFATRAWDAADAKLDRNGELLSVHSFLRQRFQQVHVTQTSAQPDNQDSPVAFTGNGRSMEFLGTMPANIADGGFYEISLESQIARDGTNLFISWRPFDEEGTASVSDGPDNSRILLRGIREVRFDYFGKSSEAVAPQWWGIWPSRDTAPSLIRMQVLFEDGDPRSWPELLVAPAIANTVLRLQ